MPKFYKKSIGKNVTFYLFSDTFLPFHLIKTMNSVQFGPQNAPLQALKSKFRFKIKEAKQISLQVQMGQIYICNGKKILQFYNFLATKFYILQYFSPYFLHLQLTSISTILQKKWHFSTFYNFFLAQFYNLHLVAPPPHDCAFCV